MKKQPNILFILTDQQRKDTLTTYGELPCLTPNLDALSQESTTFDEAYTTCPICTPARGSLQTGLYPMHHGMISNSYNYGCMVQELPDEPELLSRQLEKLGYTPGYTGKWHLGSGVEDVKHDAYIQKFMGTIDFAEFRIPYDARPTQLGYVGDDFMGHGFGGHRYPQFLEYLKEKGLEHKIEHIYNNFYEGHQAGVVTTGVESTVEQFLVDRAKDLIGGFSKEKPWYLQLNFWGPHEPYFVPEEFVRLYDDVPLEPWENFKDEPGTEKPRIHDVKRGKIHNFADLEPIIKHYYGAISHIDYQLGRLFTYLKENDLYEDTVIVFSADHGESLGIHNGLFDKAIFMYQETCSIPLLVKAPGQTKAQRIPNFVNSCDIYSTILDYAGLNAEKRERDGKSFKPLLEGNEIPWRDCVVTECSGIGALLFSQRMLRKGHFKYVFNCGDVDELYDLAHDPYEKKNLIEDKNFKEVLADLQQALKDWMTENNDNLLFEYQNLRLRKLD